MKTLQATSSSCRATSLRSNWIYPLFSSLKTRRRNQPNCKYKKSQKSYYRTRQGVKQTSTPKNSQQQALAGKTFTATKAVTKALITIMEASKVDSLICPRLTRPLSVENEGDGDQVIFLKNPKQYNRAEVEVGPGILRLISLLAPSIKQDSNNQ